MTGELLTSIGTFLGILVAIAKLWQMSAEVSRWRGAVDTRLDVHDAQHADHTAAQRSLSRRVEQQGHEIDRHTRQIRHQASRITRLETGT